MYCCEYCYKCDKCNELFTSKGDLRKHKKCIFKLNEITEYNDVEKTKILYKMRWEGGLLSFMSYGIPNRLYHKYYDQFVYFYKNEDLIRDSNKSITKEFKEFEKTILNYLTVPNVKYTDDELNAVNYVFSEKA